MSSSEDGSDYQTQMTYGSGFKTRSISKVRSVFSFITVEPVVFLYALGFSLTMVITPVLYFEKTCKVGAQLFGEKDLSYDDEICEQLDSGNYTEEQDYVQETVATMNLVTMFVKGIPPIIFALFIGPWSDKFGRKFLIVFPLIGYVLYDVWFLINVIFFDYFTADWLMLEFMQYWAGGYMCFFLGLYSYASDVSDESTRTVRIAVVDFVFFSGLSIGSGVSGKVKNAYGYETIYATAAVFHILAMLYGFFFIKDSHQIRKRKEMMSSNSSAAELTKENSPEPPAPKLNFLAIFNFRNIIESFKVAFRRREGGVRHIVIILITLFGMYNFSNGISNININYAKKKFSWNTTDEFTETWSYVQSFSTGANLFAIGFIMPIMTQVLKLRDLSITAICVTSSLLGVTTILLAHKWEYLFLAYALRMFSDVVTVGIRSALTKIVGSNDVGKVFACVGAIQAFVGLLSPLYSLVYRNTLEWHLGFVYCISCTVLASMLVLILYAYLYMRKFEKWKKNKQLMANQAQASVQVIGTIFQPKYKEIDPDTL